MKSFVIAGNWKMNLNSDEVISFFRTYSEHISPISDEQSLITKIICPMYPLIALALEHARGTGIQIGAQNVSQYDKGAYTGEVSANAIKSIGIPYCIIGHSERRQYFGDTDATIREKWLRLKAEKIHPIVCVGETLAERDSGDTFVVLKRQIQTIFKDMAWANEDEKILVAYEPVWAIGTGKTATTHIAQEAHQYIRTLLADFYGERAKDIPILYGGSVKPANIKDLLEMPDIDGALIGGASQDGKDFAQMVNITRELL